MKIKCVNTYIITLDQEDAVELINELEQMHQATLPDILGSMLSNLTVAVNSKQ